MDRVAWRYADAAVSPVGASRGVPRWDTCRNEDGDGGFGLIVEFDDGDTDSLADALWGVIWHAHDRWWAQHEWDAVADWVSAAFEHALACSMCWGVAGGTLCDEVGVVESRFVDIADETTGVW